MGRVREEKKDDQKEKVSEERRSRCAKQCVFPVICGSGGSKSRLAKAAGAEPAGQMRDEKLHAVVARSTFPSQHAQDTSASEHFWKLDVEKVHAVVARSTFRNQKCKTLTGFEHFWTFGRSDGVLRGKRRGLCTLSKVSKT